MLDVLEVRIVDRRDFLLMGTAAVLATAFFAGAAAGDDKSPGFDEALKKITGDAKPIESKIALELPEIAENGNTVPFNVAVDSPMTEKDYVKAIHVLSTGNPQALVATFHLTPASGKAAVSSRMRLAKTQDIYALAELSDGKVLLGKRTVKVTIGGCGG